MSGEKDVSDAPANYVFLSFSHLKTKSRPRFQNAAGLTKVTWCSMSKSFAQHVADEVKSPVQLTN